jgi:hypothetical protein
MGKIDYVSRLATEVTMSVRVFVGGRYLQEGRKEEREKERKKERRGRTEGWKEGRK